MNFAKLEREFREIILSGQINVIKCLNERIFSSYTLFKGYYYFFFLFQHELHQSTNMFEDDGVGSTVARNHCSDRHESFGYGIIDASM